MLPVDLKQTRIGIKPLFEAGQAPEGQDAQFEVVLIDGAGKPMASDKIAWTLTQLDQSWQWYRRDGNWTYDSVTVKRKVAGDALAIAADHRRRSRRRLDGRYASTSRLSNRTDPRPA